eukprot:7281808-Prymnesium_polylepis.1
MKPFAARRSSPQLEELQQLGGRPSKLRALTKSAPAIDEPAAVKVAEGAASKAKNEADVLRERVERLTALTSEMRDSAEKDGKEIARLRRLEAQWRADGEEHERYKQAAKALRNNECARPTTRAWKTTREPRASHARATREPPSNRVRATLEHPSSTPRTVAGAKR